MNDLIELSFSNKNYETHKIKVRKMVSKMESTRKVPCVQYEHETCRSIEDNQLILEKFHCRIPMLYSGKHLDTIISNATPNCNESIIEEALDLIMNKESKCIRTRTCEKTRFKSTNKVQFLFF